MSDAPIEFRVPIVDEREHRALRALYTGTASEHQQRVALKVIINKLSRAQDLLYIPGNTEGTAFINGRAFVGQQLLKYLNLPIGKITDEDQKTGGD